MWPEKTVATWWEVDEEGTKTRGASRGGEDNGDMHGYGSVGDDATGGSQGYGMWFLYRRGEMALGGLT